MLKKLCQASAITFALYLLMGMSLQRTNSSAHTLSEVSSFLHTAGLLHPMSAEQQN